MSEPVNDARKCIIARGEVWRYVSVSTLKCEKILRSINELIVRIYFYLWDFVKASTRIGIYYVFVYYGRVKVGVSMSSRYSNQTNSRHFTNLYMWFCKNIRKRDRDQVWKIKTHH